MNFKPVYIALFIVCLLGCNSKTDKLIIDYEWRCNKITVSIIDSSTIFKPFYVTDSLALLQKTYDSVLFLTLTALNKQWLDMDAKYTEANNELATIKNPLMKKVYGFQVNNIKNKKVRLENIIYIYKNEPQKTRLNFYLNTMNTYATAPDAVLGFTIKVYFKGKEGLLPESTYSNTYLFNVDKNAVLGVIR